MKIYVASSWRNNRQPEVVNFLRELGHEVYDFKNPEPYTGFAWSEIDPNWERWTNEEYFEALRHPRAIQGFANDFNAMNWADICVMVLPCGRSAHTEAGWMQGMDKPTIILVEQKTEPKLVYKIFELVTDSLGSVGRYVELLNTRKMEISNNMVKNYKIGYTLRNNSTLMYDCVLAVNDSQAFRRLKERTNQDIIIKSFTTSPIL